MGFADRLLAPGERVVHRTHRHWLILLRWAGGGFALVALGLAMAALYAGGSAWEGFGGEAGATVGLVLAGVGALVALPGWLRWRSELYLVTDRRVVQVEGIFHKQALDSGLAKVNDVRLHQTFLGRLLGYGTLEIITASESGINRLDHLPRPVAFKRAMMASAEHAAAGTAAVAGATGPVAAVPRVAPADSVERAPADTRSAADRLADLEELRRRGLLDDAEYAAKRAEILRGV